MEKRKLGKLWVGIVLLINVLFLVYLQVYQEAGSFYFGIPEALIVLVVFVLGVVATNSVFGWLYLGKPALRELFVPPRPDKTTGQPVPEDD
jgi:hypothetical protein